MEKLRVTDRQGILSRPIVVRIAIVAALLTLAAVLSAQEKSACMVPDCDQAKEFFQKFQHAVNTDQRQEVAKLVRYPLRSNRNGKATVVQNSTQLLAQYDSILDPPTLCALKAATVDDVWGSWRGFTVSNGVIWWDRMIPKSAGHVNVSDLAKYPFGVFSVNHGGVPPKGCETK